MPELQIDPRRLGFDIDGVIADTMRLFLDIARVDYNIEGLKYEQIDSYNISDCLDNIDMEIKQEILDSITDGSYSLTLMPIEGADRVLKRISGVCDLTLVTARKHPGPIPLWIEQVLDISYDKVDLITTGDYELKANILLKKDIAFFMEDRLETCYMLEDCGITPIVFKQPWNRVAHHFTEVSCWKELEAMIRF